MLDRFLKFVTGTIAGHRAGRHFEDNDCRLAATALLIHIISIDGEPSGHERHKLQALLEYRFDLDASAARALIAAASKAEDESIDLDRFTSLINRDVNDDGRRRIVEMMWEMVFTDDRVSEIEESVVWRAADLLGIPADVRLELERKVAAERGRRADRANSI